MQWIFAMMLIVPLVYEILGAIAGHNAAQRKKSRDA
jgi:hypothetical protein